MERQSWLLVSARICLLIHALCCSRLLVTDSCMYVLRHLPRQKDTALVISRHSLRHIVKITSKKKMPELITFKYGTNDESGMNVTEIQRFIIDKAGHYSLDPIQ